MATNSTRKNTNRDKKEIVEMHWTYTENRRWKHHQSITGVESTRETEERAPHTELEEKTNFRAESKKHHKNEMQENIKEQDKI